MLPRGPPRHRGALQDPRRLLPLPGRLSSRPPSVTHRRRLGTPRGAPAQPGTVTAPGLVRSRHGALLQAILAALQRGCHTLPVLGAPAPVTTATSGQSRGLQVSPAHGGVSPPFRPWGRVPPHGPRSPGSQAALSAAHSGRHSEVQASAASASSLWEKRGKEARASLGPASPPPTASSRRDLQGYLPEPSAAFLPALPTPRAPSPVGGTQRALVSAAAATEPPKLGSCQQPPSSQESGSRGAFCPRGFTTWKAGVRGWVLARRLRETSPHTHSGCWQDSAPAAVAGLLGAPGGPWVSALQPGTPLILLTLLVSGNLILFHHLRKNSLQGCAACQGLAVCRQHRGTTYPRGKGRPGPWPCPPGPQGGRWEVNLA